MYSLQPIRSQEDYKASLKEIERLFEAPQGTPEFDRLEILVTLVEAYENKHEPIVMPDPIEAILYYLESRGLTQQHLESVIGSHDRATDDDSDREQFFFEVAGIWEKKYHPRRHSQRRMG